ncbi:hypothetical protein [Elizabethkingia anophelis]|uniref:Lipocalin-like domain-containing protein n=1 Tax=Elizabethkingia anophelis TaxID=1117645 RepID=A0AAU8UWA3_9FLAO|nr:hypothetical protein [Elizabethkingia anophelis]AQX02199.1 hypothetical protein BBD32_12340 [Elizabethkingia anophelis]OPB58903.1 hypothetical protein BAY11_17935 [Elizabethkingia anophelis]
MSQPFLETSRNNLEGVWINKYYIEQVKKTKSPYTSQLTSPDILYFNFKINKFSDQDGILIGSAKDGVNYHGTVMLNRDNNNLFIGRFLPNDSKSLEDKFSINPLSKNKLEMFFLQKEKRVIYRKSLTSSFDQELRKLLFSGEYTDKMTGAKVTFANDGIVKGLKDYGKYSIVYTFVGDSKATDMVWFYKKDNSDISYGYFFKILGNILELELLEGSIESPSLEATGKKILLQRDSFIN